VIVSFKFSFIAKMPENSRIDLSVLRGRLRYPSGSGNGTMLVRLKRGDHGKHNVIALTAKGRRLVEAIGYHPTDP